MEISTKQTCEDLVALVKHVKVKLESIAEKHGLTHMQLYAMNSVHNGDVTMGRVAGNLHCDASNITGIIDRLVVQGLVSRQESAQDRRAKILKLTAKGQKIFDDAMAQLPTALDCAKLNASERKMLHDLITRIV